MIGALSGTLAEIEVSGDTAIDLIVDVHGVGYRVVVTAGRAARLGPVGSPLALSIYTHVREGAITLYGFGDAEERRMFELLIATHGVGPALAMAILGVLSPSALANAVAAGDLASLTLVPGVGRKTAERLALELAQRLEMMQLRTPVLLGTAADQRSLVEVREALVALGYGADEIRQALEHLGDEASEDVGELLRAALRELAPAR